VPSHREKIILDPEVMRHSQRQAFLYGKQNYFKFVGPFCVGNFFLATCLSFCKFVCSNRNEIGSTIIWTKMQIIWSYQAMGGAKSGIPQVCLEKIASKLQLFDCMIKHF